MPTTAPSISLDPQATAPILDRLKAGNERFARSYPGDSTSRQPVHTVYGGAQLFVADRTPRMGGQALKALEESAPNPAVFARAVGMRGAETLPVGAEAIARLEAAFDHDPAALRGISEPAWLAWTVYRRVVEKLRREPVEDFRIDFEDGFGNRPDAEEDHHAVRAAQEVARGLAEGTLPPFIGIRTKTFSEELRGRAIRTMDVFISTLLDASGGRLPQNFVVTLPKVTIPEQVEACAALLGQIEAARGLAPGSLEMEIMVETPQSIFDRDGSLALPALVRAGEGRVVGAHFGTYDYTAGCNVTAAHQEMGHPSCQFALHAMQVALAGTGVNLSDGATNVMPIGPHRAPEGGRLTHDQLAENRTVVHRAWKLHHDDIRRGLRNGFYQGWDLNPAQLPTRYAAVFSFFLEGAEAASVRLRNFLDKAAQATLVGDVFDDAATGQGLLNYFLRGLTCGAITEQEALMTGLSLDELRGRSFVKILNNRRTGA